MKTINPKISHFDTYLSRFQKNLNFQKWIFLFFLFFLFTKFLKVHWHINVIIFLIEALDNIITRIFRPIWSLYVKNSRNGSLISKIRACQTDVGWIYQQKFNFSRWSFTKSSTISTILKIETSNIAENLRKKIVYPVL